MRRLTTVAVAAAMLWAFDSKGSQAHIRPGGVEIVAAHGRILNVRVDGFADVELRSPMRSNGVFRIASLTKQFTAVAILKLVQDGRLSLGDKLAARLSDCPPSWSNITIRQLLSHTSGLSGDNAILFAHIHDDLAPRQLVDAYAMLPLVSPPGERFEYSNLNYWILGLVIEDTARRSYGEFVDRYVLSPAGMKQTQLSGWDRIIPRRVRGYEIGASGASSNARYFNPTLSYSAGGYVSSATDLVRWYHALASGRILSRRMIKIALTPVTLMDGSKAPYGLGWYITINDRQTIAHHGGSSFGFRSYVYWSPRRDLVALTLLNSSGPDEPKEQTLKLFWRFYPSKGRSKSSVLSAGRNWR